MNLVVAGERFRLVAVPARSRQAALAEDVAAGLTASPKRLSCRYFYDREGSRLFEEICRLPEYYLTRAETAILRAHAAEVADRFVGDTTLIELGSGSAVKTRLLLEAFLRRRPGLRYVPVDISGGILEESSLALLNDYPGLEILAIAGEYQEGLRHLATATDRPKLILWLGSNIGNFERAEAAAFLGRVRQTMAAGDALLVGIDLRKDRAVLEPAYDDSRGVTAAFNRNLLVRINRELGGHFDPDAFRHRAVYNEGEGRVEIYLVSSRAQRVAVDRLGLEVAFAEGEAIHTENSYKYSPAEIAALAGTAGLRLERQWFDVERRFSLNLFAPA